MGIVTDNKSHAQADKDFDLSFSEGHEIKVRFNCEILSGCEFKCKGCFVNKLGSNVGDFQRPMMLSTYSMKTVTEFLQSISDLLIYSVTIMF